MRREDCILFCGGATGAEQAFGDVAERHGIEEVNFSFEGHNIRRTRGLRVLNHEELQAGDVSLEYVSRLMKRRYTDARTIRRILQTLWYQVNSGQEIARLKESGFWVYGAAQEGVPPWTVDLSGKVALCLGGEEKGLRQHTRELCDGLLGLPMRGRVGSLNVATAAAALLYEAVRQRMAAGPAR